MQPKHILLTTDFSDHARAAYRCAAELASTCGASLYLVHFAGALPSLLPAESRDTLFDSLETVLTHEAKEHPAFADVRVEPHLQRQRWTRVRQRELEENLSIDLIVMSPRGRTGLAKMLLGSFADRIVRHSSVPVLLVRQSDDETFDPRTVLVPHDFYDRPQAVLPAMRWLNRQFNSAFRFLYVYDPTWAEGRSVRGMQEQFERAVRNVKFLSVEERFAKVKSEDLQGLDVTLETAQGYPSEQVVTRANHMPADLVLLATRDGLGSVSRKVVSDAKCSVLAVPLEKDE
ncbi:MAG: universal stress protein [Planctomycetaceae bacterium]